MKRSVLAACLFLAASAAALADDCAPQSGTDPIASSLKFYTPDLLHPKFLDDAIKDWTDACSAMSGFPTLGDRGAAKVVDVVRRKHPTSDACAEAFRQSGQRDRIENYYGKDDRLLCAVDNLQDVLRHEIGHILGLGDSYDNACRGQVMYGRLPVAQVAAADCKAAVARARVGRGGGGPGGGSNPGPGGGEGLGPGPPSCATLPRGCPPPPASKMVCKTVWAPGLGLFTSCTVTSF